MIVPDLKVKLQAFSNEDLRRQLATATQEVGQLRNLIDTIKAIIGERKAAKGQV